VFDVFADGELVYSKHQSGDFPGEDDIVRRLRARAARPPD
jgi:predicted Rdx family selenoprotein